MLSLSDECFSWASFPQGITEEQNEQLTKGLLAAWKEIWNLANLRHEKKGQIRYCYLSMLRTQMREGVFALRIDLYNENWYMDEDECSAYWDATSLFSPLYDEYIEKRQKLSRYFLKQEYDIIFLQEYQRCLRFIHTFVRSKKDEMLACEEFEKANQATLPHLYIGEYKESGYSLF